MLFSCSSHQHQCSIHSFSTSLYVPAAGMLSGEGRCKTVSVFFSRRVGQFFSSPLNKVSTKALPTTACY